MAKNPHQLKVFEEGTPHPTQINTSTLTTGPTTTRTSTSPFQMTISNSHPKEGSFIELRRLLAHLPKPKITNPSTRNPIFMQDSQGVDWKIERLRS